MDRKTIIMVAILVVLIVAYFPVLNYFGIIEEPAQQPPAQQAITTDTTQAPAAQTPAPQSQELSPAAELSQTPADSVIAVDTITVRTNKYTVVLTSYGGGPVSLKLNDFTYRDENNIEMLPEADLATPEFTFAGGVFSASKIHYQANLMAGDYDATSSSFDLIYTHTQENGGRIIKTYRFYPDRYDYDLLFEVTETAKFGFERKYDLMWNTALGITEPDAGADFELMEAVAMQGGSRVTLDDWDDNNRLNQSLTGNTAWAGVRAKYFAAVMIPQNRIAEAALASGFKKDILIDGDDIEMRYIVGGLEMQFANAPVIADSFKVFVGPLDYSLMSDYDVGLEDMLGIGTTPFIGWIIKPFAIGIIWLLPRLYSIVPNYGLVIILFAFLVKVVTLPLSLKSFKSMHAMKELQPKIDELKKRHKKNPQALNKETMKLYKAHGVNPMSGCLPILPQMPLFFALFSVFRATILLRDAPFVWFIDDLSRGAATFTDPYIILVLFMIGAQFVSQKFTMASATQQNKMFGYIMPLFMGFIFYKFAAGLVLYWACFSIFSLLDYFMFRRGKKNAEIMTTAT